MSSSFVARSPGIQQYKIIKGCNLGKNDTLFTGSGIPSFDGILGTGIPIGTVTCIHEDRPRSSSNFASSMIKCIISEGLYCEHYILFLDGVEPDAKTFLEGLPTPLKSQDSFSINDKEMKNALPRDQKMTIAWRYKHLRQLDDEQIFSSGGSLSRKNDLRAYDLGRRLPDALMKSHTIRSISVFEDSFMERFFEATEQMVTKAKTEGAVLRIVVRSFASPFWPTNVKPALFIYRLRRLLSIYSENYLVFLTAPVMSRSLIADFEVQIDAIFELQSFTGTPKEEERSLSEYEGFLRIVKPLRNPGLLSLAIPDSCDISFKLKKRQLIFEPFHMPPDLDQTPSLPAAAAAAATATATAISKD